MTTREVFRAKARQLGVSDASIDRILHHLRPAYDLYDHPDNGGTEAGRLGGDPELPLDVPWDGARVFVASIDLAALPPHSLDLGLPRDGRLLLFCNGGYECVTTVGPDEFSHALHVPPGTETVRRDWSTTEYYDENLKIEPRTLYATATWDVALDEFGGLPWDVESDTLSDPALAQAIAEYRSLAGHLGPLPFERDGGSIKLGGVAYPEQDPVEEEVSADEGEAATWTPLADANYSYVFDRGEGCIYWVIPRADPSTSRFDRVAEVFQC